LTGRATTRAVGATLLALIAAAPAPAAAATARVEKLQRLGQQSYYAFVNHVAPARTAPRGSAHAITHLRRRSPVGTDDLVLVLARTKDSAGHSWYQVRLPVRPNGTTGWVRASAVGDLQPLKTWLKINTHTFTATLIKGGKVAWRARIGVGQPQWPTPRGQFFIRAKLKGYGSAGSFYGPVAFITSATSDALTDWPGGGIVGVHGTSLPGLIPGRISHGCVRVRNGDILALEKLMPVGTPLTIT
jgi:lipoprotein-anchoring transpeptidase ErfK/SrfK